MIFRAVSAILFNLSSFSDSVAHRATVLPCVVDRHSGVVDAIHYVSIAVLSSNRRDHWLKMLIIMSRMAQRPVDVLRDNERRSQSSFTVVFCSIPRVAEHKGFNYLRTC